MAQHDYVIANQSGAAFRSDLNNGLLAIVSQNSGSATPSPTYAYMWWADTTTGLLKIRNAANNAWVTVGTLATTNLGLAPLASPTFTGTVTAPTFTASTGVNIPLGSAGSPSLYFTGDTNTGLYSPGQNTVALVTAGTNRLHITSTGLVGIGPTAPDAKLHVVSGSTPSIAQLYIGQGGGSNNYYDANNHYFRDGNLNNVISTTSSTIQLFTGASERARIDSSGRLLVGTSNARSNFYNSTISPQLQIEGNDNSKAALAIIQNYSANTIGAQLVLAKNNSTTIGTNVLVDSGDILGVVSFQGNDGSDFVEAATISAVVDGPPGLPGANDMLGRLVFSTTANGASSPTERFRIGSAGQLGIGGATYGTSGQFLTSGGASAAPTWSAAPSPAALTTASGSAPSYSARAWVNFDGTANTNLTGTYSQSGTTVTVTATAHGLIAGNAVFADITSGTGVDGDYTVATVTNANTFTYTAGTSLTTSGNITIRRNTIRGSGNVSSISDDGTGDYTVNFTTAMPDANYSAVTGTRRDSGTLANWAALPTTYSTSSLVVNVMPGGSNALVDSTFVNVVIFR